MSTCVVMPECCRCCLVEENDMVYVFDILDEFDNKICNLIAECGGILITENDIYTKTICGNCLNDLANAARFRERCLKTKNILQNTIADHKEPSVICVGLESETSEIIYEQIEAIDDNERLDLDHIIEFSDEQGVHDENDTKVEYIIAKDPTELELQVFDYNSLVNNNDTDVDSVCIEKFDVQTDDKYTSEDDDEQAEAEPKWAIRPQSLQLNFTCQHCGAGFALQKNLAKHLTTHQKFVCDICLSVFESDENLQSHKSAHVESDKPVAGSLKQVDGPVILKGSSSVKLKKNFYCSYCDKAFISNSALTSHVRIHTQERPFPCSYCTKRFRTVGGQELHERRHNGLKPYKCDLCGRGFAESSNLKVHRRTHTKEKPHVCTVCNRAFSRVFLLKIHQRTHTGERPFPCNDCGKEFSQQGDLAAHRRIHTGERPHKCDICGKGFIKSSGLKQHRKRHEKKPKGVCTIKVLDNVSELIQELDDYDFGIIHEQNGTGENNQM